MKTWEDVELLVDARADVAEGPVWDVERNLLWWVDIMAGMVLAYVPGGGAGRSIDVGQHVGAIALRPDGGFVAAVQDGFAFVDPASGDVEMITDFLERDASIRMNDGKCDPAGRFFAGTMAYEATEGAGAFYRLDPDGGVTTIADHVTISNGLGWSLDRKTMYYIDSMAHGVDAFDYDVSSGAVTNRRRLIDVPASDGLPDGMTVDDEGYLWVAIFDGSCVRRYAPDGRLDGEVRLPVEKVTCPTFGGEDLSDLYITTASHAEEEPGSGGLFRCRVGVKGQPPFLFGT